MSNGKLKPSSAFEYELPPGAVVNEQRVRTRQKVLGAFGYTGELVLDVAAAGVEGTAYVAGRIVHTGVKGVRKGVRGALGQPYSDVT